MRKKVFLTGADGLLGHNLSRELSARGYAITALIEKKAPGTFLADIPGLTIMRGDILDRESMIHAIKGHDFLIHAAANTSVNPARSPRVIEVNLKGTENLLHAAFQSNLTRMLFIGTANSFQPGSKDNPGNESGIFSNARFGIDYIDSKYEALLLIRKWVAEKGIDAISLHPTFMIGPFDSKPSSGTLMINMSKVRPPAYPRGGKNYIAVKDAAIGVANALTMGRKGEDYIIGNENLSFREIFGKMAKILHIRPPWIPIPNFVTLAYGKLGDWQNALTGKLPVVNSAMARLSCDEQYYSAAKAVRELQLPQTPIDQALEESYQWFVDHDYLN
jgi:dihydroflavonol-4-reductase